MTDSSAHRVFLGWDAPPLAAAARWLADEHPGHLETVVVALPGRRAGRRLVEHLARLGAGRLAPPRIVTTGTLVDALVSLEAAPAPRMARTFAWRAALSGQGPRLSRVLHRPPSAEDHAGWMRLAASVRRLHGELGGEGLGFADVLENRLVAGQVTSEHEASRWELLRDVHAEYARLLAAQGLVDPHDARLRAIAAGAFDADAQVVLIGAADLPGLARRLLDARPAGVTALVAAPATIADAFDHLGAARAEAFAQRVVPVDLAHWRVVADPAGCADEVADWIQSLGGELTANEITLGLADPELGPVIAARLEALAVATHDPAGLPLSESPPARALAAAGAYLARRGWRELAALVRHPDVDRALRARLVGSDGVGALADEDDPADLLDQYHSEHLPARAGKDWLEDRRAKDRVAPRVAAVHSATHALLGELAAAGTRSPAEWVEAVRAFLLAIYEDVELPAATPGGRRPIEELRLLSEVLTEAAEIPVAVAPRLASTELLSELLGTAAEREVVPQQESVDAIELLGWLELPLDDAPALALVGLNEGRVPEASGADLFLPDRLRQALGLPCQARREARDRYALEALLRSRPRYLIVTPRRAASGDPLLPSRLLLSAPPLECAQRVTHALAELLAPAPPTGGGPVRPPLPLPELAPPTELSVTDFAAYLEAPYKYVLERRLRLEKRTDADEELDGLGFGNLAHDVLEHLGRSELTASNDARALERFLCAQLDALSERRFGDDVRPAVRLQIEQLRFRLQHFAVQQAAWVDQGWRIQHVEWMPRGGGVPFRVDGEPVRLKGRIDRIDWNAGTGEYALLDYKAGAAPRLSSVRRGRKKDARRWVDLQLPLYRHLAAELVGDAPVVFGYARLGKEPGQIDFDTERWTAEELEAADETARGVVRELRVADPELMRSVGRWTPKGAVLRALLGTDLVAVGGDDDDEAEETD